MLSENLQELLSAYVDGELAAAEYSRVMSALRESEAAREYVRQLRSISSQLKALPELLSPVNFTKQFLQQHQQTQRQMRKRRLTTAGMALAAGLLLATTAWLVWNNSVVVTQPNRGVALVNTNKPNLDNTVKITNVEQLNPPADYSWLMAAAKQGAAKIATGWVEFAEKTNQSIAWLANAEALREQQVLADSGSLLTGPVKQAGNIFKTVDVQLPLLVSPTEFDITALQKRWTAKGLFVLDVTSNDSVKTLNRLLDAAKKQEVPLVVDEEVTKRLEKKLPATFMVYLENANEEKLHKVLQTLDQSDRWHDQLNIADMSAQSLFFYALEQEGRKQLARGLGVSAERLQAVNASGSNKPATEKGVVLAYYPTRVADSISPEVRKTLEQMPGPKSDSVSVVFLLRQMK